MPNGWRAVHASAIATQANDDVTEEEGEGKETATRKKGCNVVTKKDEERQRRKSGGKSGRKMND